MSKPSHIDPVCQDCDGDLLPDGNCGDCGSEQAPFSLDDFGLHLDPLASVALALSESKRWRPASRQVRR